MSRRLLRLLAILVACSTVLAGVPLIAASATPDPHFGPCIRPTSCDADDVAESRSEAGEEEREEEKKEARGCVIPLFMQRADVVVLELLSGDHATLDSLQAAAGVHDAARLIRGPPAG